MVSVMTRLSGRLHSAVHPRERYLEISIAREPFGAVDSTST